MKSRDILYELYMNQTTQKKAHKFFRYLMDNDIANARKRMQLDMTTEWSALLMGDIPLEVLAQWRYKGWPNQCIICCEFLDIKIHTWKAFRKITIAGKVFENAVSHMNCFYEMET